MTVLIAPAKVPDLHALKARQLDRFARRAVLSILKQLRYGSLTLVENNQQHHFNGLSDRFSIQATITVYHIQFFSRIFLGGSVGAAEAYMDGLWAADDLTRVMRVLALNQQTFFDLERGFARLTVPIKKAYHLLRKNTRTGSRKNILAHYDLGNEFYALFLDNTMTYSCGVFEHEDSSLQDASEAKYDRICRKLNLTDKDRVMEIGTGWGGFALYAARNYGAHVTTTTISDQQYQFALSRIHAAGLQDRVRLLKKDYRDLDGKYDRLVSIEMIEAVGHQYLKTFFQKCSQLLKDDGMMALQAITIRDQMYERHAQSVDFIKRYIFPGSCLTAVSAIANTVTSSTDMRVLHLEDITAHYVRTLHEWRRRFFANIEKVRALGFSEPFIRMWEYYLCYCEGGFAERYIGDVQMVFQKPLGR